MTVLQKIEETKLICRNCNALKFVTDNVTGEITCSRCGCVFSENSEDRGMERRNFSDVTDNTRTGPGMSLKRHDKGLFTIIGAQNKDSVGKLLSAKTAQTFCQVTDTIWDSQSSDM